MSLRPSGCGGRTDAVPPQVEKRRRLSRPSSFIMGPVEAPSVGEREGARGRGGRQELEGGKSNGGPIHLTQLVCKVTVQSTHEDPHPLTQ